MQETFVCVWSELKSLLKRNIKQFFNCLALQVSNNVHIDIVIRLISISYSNGMSTRLEVMGSCFLYVHIYIFFAVFYLHTVSSFFLNCC